MQQPKFSKREWPPMMVRSAGLISSSIASTDSPWAFQGASRLAVAYHFAGVKQGTKHPGIDVVSHAAGGDLCLRWKR